MKNKIISTEGQTRQRQNGVFNREHNNDFPLTNKQLKEIYYKKGAWENCVEITEFELAERKFWKDTVSYFNPNLLKGKATAEKETFFSKCVKFLRGGDKNGLGEK